jgi:Zn-dependent peptidase ImmA (M78 family)/DNA-binding XRE family transcriptional regulator
MINGERIRQAREIRGLRQVQLAEGIGVDQSHVSLLEQNARDASERVLHAVALHTGFPVAFFRQPSGPEFPLGSLLYRRRQSLRSADRDRLRQMARLAYEIADGMLRSFDAIELRIPQCNDGTRIAAEVTRSALGLSPDTPALPLVRRLEKNGVLVLAIPDAVEEHDAFSLWADTEPRKPIIVITVGKPGDRQRFNIGHELGHIVMHRAFTGDLAQVEEEADAFAAELLMPEEAMRREIRSPVTASGLAELKARWGVSMQALAMRARGLGLLSENQARYLFQQFSARGWRKREPVAIPAERPRLFKKLAESLYGVPPDARKVAERVNAPEKLVAAILAIHASSGEGGMDGPTTSPAESGLGSVVPFRKRAVRGNR